MLRLSEVYLSVQGEGPRVGSPTVFVRFAGCNLRCPLWPCDTPHAIDPSKFRHEWRTVTYGNVLEEVLQACEGRTVPNICFTGGEPALQPYEDLELLVKSFTDQGFKIIEAFTNGTIVYPEWWLENIYTVMDWKLPGSGERIDVPERWENASQLNTGDVIKFTIKDAFDYEIATDIYRQLVQMWSEDEIDPSDRPTIYYGPVWGAIEPKQLVKWVLGDGYDWKLNLQTHNLIWDREKRGI